MLPVKTSASPPNSLLGRGPVVNLHHSDSDFACVLTVGITQASSILAALLDPILLYSYRYLRGMSDQCSFPLRSNNDCIISWLCDTSLRSTSASAASKLEDNHAPQYDPKQKSQQVSPARPISRLYAPTKQSSQEWNAKGKNAACRVPALGGR